MRRYFIPGVCLAIFLAIAFALPLGVGPQPAVQDNFGAAAPALHQSFGGHRPWTGNQAGEDRHWQEHGREFPQFATEQAYVQGAQSFVTHPPAGTLTKHRDNGDTLYFDPDSGTFAVMAEDGALRTFFKPHNGMAYWNRQ